LLRGKPFADAVGDHAGGSRCSLRQVGIIGINLSHALAFRLCPTAKASLLAALSWLGLVTFGDLLLGTSVRILLSDIGTVPEIDACDFFLTDPFFISARIHRIKKQGAISAFRMALFLMANRRNRRPR
jgi:hypothetical protein